MEQTKERLCGRQLLFPTGKVVITPNAQTNLPPYEVLECLFRHTLGDWGDLDDEDVAENEYALVHGCRLFSVYHDSSGKKFYIITEHDRSVTTILLPEDY